MVCCDVEQYILIDKVMIMRIIGIGLIAFFIAILNIILKIGMEEEKK